MAFAVHGGTFTFVAAMFMTGATYLTSAWVWADGLPLSIAVDELVLMTLAPAMVRVGWFRGTAESRPMEFRLNDLDFELLRYLQAGLTYDQIADRRNVSTESTKVAISRLYRRLGARSRDDAVNIAHLRKMI